MENKKTITYLNSKIWYRLLKVIFVFFILASILAFNSLLVIEEFKKLDNNKTLILCTLKKEKSFTPKQIGIMLYNYDLGDKFDYKKFFENYNNYDIQAILRNCYDETNTDIFAIQKKYEVYERAVKDNKEQLLESDIKEVQQISDYITDSQKAEYLDYSVKLFDIKPVYTYSEFMKYLTLGNLLILLIFEILRRVFYYIILGKIRPKN